MADAALLKKTAQELLTGGRGILAADESTGTIGKRFETINIENTEPNRRAYREMLFTTPGIGQYISGVIMYDETIRQSAADGRTFVQIQQSQNIHPGIKVDLGTDALPDSPEEKFTKGIEGLSDRLKEYVALGAKFAKWRAVITIGDGIPTDACIQRNADDLAEYARICQEAGLVPIVEPEVLMDGAHSMARCEEVSKATLTAVFSAIQKKGVLHEGMVLKTNMVVPGKKSGETASAAQVAEATLRVFNAVLPADLAGQAFLSGGQKDVEATENLNAMYASGSPAWPLTFSYGRALQDSPLRTWAGKSENVAAAQKTLLHRSKMNFLAAQGKYSPEMESELTI
jgi:fructose-bisphosphate aldolase, class I